MLNHTQETQALTEHHVVVAVGVIGAQEVWSKYHTVNMLNTKEEN